MSVTVPKFCLGVIFYEDHQTQMIYWDKSKMFYTQEDANNDMLYFNDFSIFMKDSFTFQDWIEMTDEKFHQLKLHFFTNQFQKQMKMEMEIDDDPSLFDLDF